MDIDDAAAGDGFTGLTELTFGIDPDAVADRSGDRRLADPDVIDDETLRLLGRENRVALARGPVVRVENALLAAGDAVYDVPLKFVVHAHPQCTFSWARLVVDFVPTRGALILDMSPRDVEDTPVEVETTVGADLTFSVAANAIDIGAKPEFSRKRTVYFPRLTASGVGFSKAVWDFYAKAGDYLHADKELRVLVKSPAHDGLGVHLTVRAEVRMRGLAGKIPLLARTGGPEEILRLI